MKADKTISMVVDGVSVEYLSTSSDPNERSKATLGQRVIATALGRAPKVKVNAVRDVSFVAFEGDFIGLMGTNGAGKSTLLRVLAGSEPPSTGTVFAKTKPSLLSINGALMPELSGVENAVLGLLALGFSPAEARQRIPDIEEFCSIGDAIYRPMKTYSSGMSARLRFAIATSARQEILLIDEALSTGDSTFQAKSEERMQAMLSNAGTIFLVSHSVGVIKRMCNRVIWLHEGEVVADGDVEAISSHYQNWSAAISKTDRDAANAIMNEASDTYPAARITKSDTTLRRVDKYQPRHQKA
ncbi:MAG: ABC transporter ATP-binding protein [Gleimia sp.]|jgi:teichoic acid transport system ATP-binding protein